LFIGVSFRSSPAAVNGNAYLHYPLRYQAEKGGLVDVNFASYPQAIVKYAPGHMPRAAPYFDWNPEAFDWHWFQANRYRYIIVRELDWGPDDLFSGSDCDLRVVKWSGSWIWLSS
jgi:hypothetical protein